MRLSVTELLALLPTGGSALALQLSQMEKRLMAKLDDAIAAQTAAFNDLRDAFGSMEEDLRGEHKSLLDALEKMSQPTSNVSDEQLDQLRDVTTKIGELAARARAVVQDTPAPQPIDTSDIGSGAGPQPAGAGTLPTGNPMPTDVQPPDRGQQFPGDVPEVPAPGQPNDQFNQNQGTQPDNTQADTNLQEGNQPQPEANQRR